MHLEDLLIRVTDPETVDVVQMTVTWTSGYGMDEGVPVVQWGFEENKSQFLTPAYTLTFSKHDMCGTFFSRDLLPLKNTQTLFKSAELFGSCIVTTFFDCECRQVVLYGLVIHAYFWD